MGHNMKTNNFGHRSIGRILEESESDDELIRRLIYIVSTYKLPITEVARNCGVSRATVYKWINGKCAPVGSIREFVSYYVKEYEPK